MTSKTQAAARTIHARKSGLTVPHDSYGGRVLYQYETVTLTRAQVEATLSREGTSWLDLTPDQQIEKWGEQRFAEGPAPEGAVIGADDKNGLRFRQWQAATKYAQATSDPSERAAALRAVREKFPEQGGSSQWTLSRTPRD